MSQFEQTVKLPVIWESMVLIWGDSNGMHVNDQLGNFPAFVIVIGLEINKSMTLVLPWAKFTLKFKLLHWESFIEMQSMSWRLLFISPPNEVVFVYTGIPLSVHLPFLTVVVVECWKNRDCRSGRHILWHCISSLWCWWHATNLDRDQTWTFKSPSCAVSAIVQRP